MNRFQFEAEKKARASIGRIKKRIIFDAYAGKAIASFEAVISVIEPKVYLSAFYIEDESQIPEAEIEADKGFVKRAYAEARIKRKMERMRK